MRIPRSPSKSKITRLASFPVMIAQEKGFNSSSQWMTCCSLGSSVWYFPHLTSGLLFNPQGTMGQPNLKASNGVSTLLKAPTPDFESH